MDAPRRCGARGQKVVDEFLPLARIELNLLDQRDLVTSLVNSFMAENAGAAPPPPPPTVSSAPAPDGLSSRMKRRPSLYRPATRAAQHRSGQAQTAADGAGAHRHFGRRQAWRAKICPATLPGLIAELLNETKIQLNAAERAELVKQLLDDMLGLGPLEPLLADETIIRNHGQRAEAGLYRTQGQARFCPTSVPRQRACAGDRDAHRDGDRPPHRRKLAACAMRV